MNRRGLVQSTQVKNAEERPTKFATKLILSIQNLLLAFVRAEMATDDYHGNDTGNSPRIKIYKAKNTNCESEARL